LGLSEKTVPATRFREKWKFWLTGGFHDEHEGGSWRSEHGGAVGELWRMEMQCWSELDDGGTAAAKFQNEKGERERVDASRRSRATPWRSLLTVLKCQF